MTKTPNNTNAVTPDGTIDDAALDKLRGGLLPNLPAAGRSSWSALLTDPNQIVPFDPAQPETPMVVPLELGSGQTPGQEATGEKPPPKDGIVCANW